MSYSAANHQKTRNSQDSNGDFAAEENLWSFLQNVPVAIYEIDYTNGRFLRVNDTACRVSGYSKEEFLSMTAPQLLTPESSARFLERMKKAALGQKIAESIEFDVNVKNGRKLSVMLSIHPIIENGKIVRALVAGYDITERKKAEEALRESEDRFKVIASSTPDHLLVMDNELHYTMVLNPQLGLAEKDMIGKTDYDILPEEEADKLTKIKRQVLETGKTATVEMPLISKKGEQQFFSGSYVPKYDENGKVDGLIGYFRNISEHKKAEERLLESERLYHTVFDNSRDGFQLIQLIYDKKGKPVDHKFLQINKAYEKIIGVKAEQIIDKTARAISPNAEPYWFEIPDEVIKTGQTQHVEIYNKDINKWLDCYYFPYSKDVAGTLFRDVTERVNLQKQLQDKERLAAIGATAGMVGHDIRNPLQAMMGDIYLLRADLTAMPECETKEGVIESLDSIENNIAYVNKIVGDLQDYTRPLKPSRVLIRVDDKIRNALKNVYIPPKVKLHVTVQDGLVIESDADYLRRALTNLINNSVQAMPNGGDLAIDAKSQNGKVIFSIQDTGVGISEDIKPNLFRPLFTTKSKGQGLGLAVVKRLVEALNGTISFESEVGKGTKFTIELPTNH